MAQLPPRPIVHPIAQLPEDVRQSGRRDHPLARRPVLLGGTAVRLVETAALSCGELRRAEGGALWK